MEELTLPWPEDEEKDSAGESRAAAGEKPGGKATKPAAREAEAVLTVSEVNRMARQSLERMSVTVQGEVSGLNTRYPYYVYLDLRDKEASLPAIMGKRLFEGLDFKLEEGAVVVVRGTLTLYEKQGKYQIRVAEVRPSGEGEIQRRIEALKRKLQAEGLFDDARKKPLPPYPERIGVVTSPRGAAIRDVTVTLRRRFSPASVFVRGVQVQGESAARQICGALDFFDSEWPVDLVILARGGGSIQDLEPFSTEEVVRTLARMRVPVVTGIGHEPDVSIADLVADRRASTPTAAAEAAVPDRREVGALLGKAAAGFRRHVTTEHQASSKQLDGLRRLPLFRNPDFLMGRFLQRFERAAVSLPQSPKRGLVRGRHRLAVLVSRPVFRLSSELVSGRSAQLEAMRSRLALGGVRAIERETGNLERIKARAQALSPLAVLERGYSITFDSRTGAVVRSPDEVGLGAPLRIKLAKGDLDAEVTGKE
jgi:exodeoxyribonuclease VII large subunit